MQLQSAVTLYQAMVAARVRPDLHVYLVLTDRCYNAVVYFLDTPETKSINSKHTRLPRYFMPTPNTLKSKFLRV